MNEYREILEHRIQQFAAYIKLMEERRKELTEGNSFIIFEERYQGGDAQPEAEAKQAIAMIAVVETVLMSSRVINGMVEVELPREGWRSEDEIVRFVQFSFGRGFLHDAALQRGTHDPA